MIKPIIKKVILKTIAVSLVFGGTAVAFAEENVQINTTVNTGAQTEMSLRARMEAEARRARLDAELKNRPNLQELREKEAENRVKSLRENASSTAEKRREEIKNTLEAKKLEIKTNIQEKRADMLERKVTNRFEKMNERFQATIERIGSIMARVVTRIEKIKNGGGNVTAAEKFVEESKASIELAKAGLADLKIASEATVQLENATTTRAQAKTSLENLAKIAKSIGKNLQQAHVSLAKAVGSLRGQSQLHATSTAEVKTGGGAN